MKFYIPISSITFFCNKSKISAINYTLNQHDDQKSAKYISENPQIYAVSECIVYSKEIIGITSFTKLNQIYLIQTTYIFY